MVSNNKLLTSSTILLQQEEERKRKAEKELQNKLRSMGETDKHSKIELSDETVE